MGILGAVAFLFLLLELLTTPRECNERDQPLQLEITADQAGIAASPPLLTGAAAKLWTWH